MFCLANTAFLNLFFVLFLTGALNPLQLDVLAQIPYCLYKPGPASMFMFSVCSVIPARSPANIGFLTHMSGSFCLLLPLCLFLKEENLKA